MLWYKSRDFSFCSNGLNLTSRVSTLDVRICRRQILTSKVDPRTVRVGLQILIMAVDPLHRYSNEAERA